MSSLINVLTRTWEELAEFGNSKLLSSSYVWLVIVPIAAKASEKLSNPIELTGIGKGIKIDIELPFSWQVLYFSAVFISIAQSIFYWKCPYIIRKFKYYSDFKTTGMWIGSLTHYSSNNKIRKNMGLLVSEGTKSIQETNIDVDELSRRKIILLKADELAKNTFYEMRSTENVTNMNFRVICFICYIFGFSLVLYLFFENLVYVSNSIFVNFFSTSTDS